jgi:hypothetical protein
MPVIVGIAATATPAGAGAELCAFAVANGGEELAKPPLPPMAFCCAEAAFCWCGVCGIVAVTILEKKGWSKMKGKEGLSERAL